jgi:carboxyl-terminal processing protease
MKNILFISALFCSAVLFSQTDKATTTLKFEEVFGYLESNYVDEFDGRKITDAAIVAMLKELDPHTYMISAEDVSASNDRINGSFVGVGIQFRIVEDTLTVVNTIQGGPCEQVGVQAGDKIVKVDQENIAGIGLKNSGVRERLLGEKNSLVVLGIKRKGEKELLEFDVRRDKIPLYSVAATWQQKKRATLR